MIVWRLYMDIEGSTMEAEFDFEIESVKTKCWYICFQNSHIGLYAVSSTTCRIFYQGYIKLFSLPALHYFYLFFAFFWKHISATSGPIFFVKAQLDWQKFIVLD